MSQEYHAVVFRLKIKDDPQHRGHAAGRRKGLHGPNALLLGVLRGQCEARSMLKRTPVVLYRQEEFRFRPRRPPETASLSSSSAFHEKSLPDLPPRF